MNSKLLISLVKECYNNPEESAHKAALIDYLIENEDPRANLITFVPNLIKDIKDFKSSCGPCFSYDRHHHQEYFPNLKKVKFNGHLGNRKPWHKIKNLGKLLSVALIEAYKLFKIEYDISSYNKIINASELINCYLMDKNIVYKEFHDYFDYAHSLWGRLLLSLTSSKVSHNIYMNIAEKFISISYYYYSGKRYHNTKEKITTNHFFEENFSFKRKDITFLNLKPQMSGRFRNKLNYRLPEEEKERVKDLIEDNFFYFVCKEIIDRYKVLAPIKDAEFCFDNRKTLPINLLKE